MKNLFKYEDTIRVTVGIFIIIFAVHFQNYIWLPLGILLHFTGMKKTCPIYISMLVSMIHKHRNDFISLNYQKLQIRDKFQDSI